MAVLNDEEHPPQTGEQQYRSAQADHEHIFDIVADDALASLIGGFFNGLTARRNVSARIHARHLR